LVRKEKLMRLRDMAWSLATLTALAVAVGASWKWG
jgi:hypothetical protein